MLAYDDTLKPIPSLAESWELSDDYTQIKLNLRKGVQFHTGRELTSDDVKYNLERTKDPARSSPSSRSAWPKPGPAETPDKYTVILTSDRPRIGVFDFLTQLWIADRQTLEGPDAASKAVGTGPFTFVEWVQGDHVSFTRNKNYWLSGRPYLDGYNVAITKDPQAMMVRFEAGALDFVNYPQTSDALRLDKDPKYQVLPAYDLGFDYAIWINVAAPPFDKKEVRQAMNYALDRQRFVDTTLGGLVGPADATCPGRRARPPASPTRTRTTPSIWTARAHCSRAPACRTSTPSSTTSPLGRSRSSPSWRRSTRPTWPHRRQSQYRADGQRHLVGHGGQGRVQGHGHRHAEWLRRPGCDVWVADRRLWRGQRVFQLQGRDVYAAGAVGGLGDGRRQAQAAVCADQRHHPRPVVHDARELVPGGVGGDGGGARRHAHARRAWAARF